MTEIYAGFNANSASLRRSMETNLGASSRLMDQLGAGSLVASPTYDPASAAIAAGGTERLAILDQCNRNAIQTSAVIKTVTGILSSTGKVLTEMERLAAQANNSVNDTSTLQMLDQQFQRLISQIDQNANSARAGTKQLLTGMASTVTANPTATAAPAVAGMVAGPTNTLAGTLNTANTSGFIDGVAMAATATLISGSSYGISVTVGSQTFTGQSTPADGGVIVLTSTTDNGNHIAFDYAADVSGITNATTLQTALQTSLGINSASKAVFTSKSDNTLYGAVTINPSSALTQGTWQLSYTQSGADGIFKITNGMQSDTVTTTATAGQTSTLTFATLGISLDLVNFDGTATLAQRNYNVSGSSGVAYQAQIGLKTTDSVSVIFQPATSASLGLGGLNLKTTSVISNVINSLKAAITNISSQVGQYASTSTQMDYLVDNLKLTLENEEAVKASFTEPNVAVMLSQIQKFESLYDLAESQLLKSLEKQKSVSALVKQASR